QKGLHILLASLALLRDRGLLFRWELIGDGERRSELEQLAADLGLSELVTFRGALAQPEVQEAYHVADLFALSSFGEGVPIELMEALAKEVPVVATAVGGVQELVLNRINGLVVPPSDAHLLADAIGTMAGDTALRRQLAAEGRRTVCRDFDMWRNGQHLARVLHEAVDHKTARRESKGRRAAQCCARLKRDTGENMRDNKDEGR
ncbi:MAG: glycosyltransferase, partial [Alphaproteobacteria bacterium]